MSDINCTGENLEDKKQQQSDLHLENNTASSKCNIGSDSRKIPDPLILETAFTKVPTNLSSAAKNGKLKSQLGASQSHR